MVSERCCTRLPSWCCYNVYQAQEYLKRNYLHIIRYVDFYSKWFPSSQTYWVLSVLNGIRFRFVEMLHSAICKAQFGPNLQFSRALSKCKIYWNISKIRLSSYIFTVAGSLLQYSCISSLMDSILPKVCRYDTNWLRQGCISLTILAVWRRSQRKEELYHDHLLLWRWLLPSQLVVILPELAFIHSFLLITDTGNQTGACCSPIYFEAFQSGLDRLIVVEIDMREGKRSFNLLKYF